MLIIRPSKAPRTLKVYYDYPNNNREKKSAFIIKLYFIKYKTIYFKSNISYYFYTLLF